MLKNTALVFLILAGMQCHARQKLSQMFSSFCERHIVAQHPFEKQIKRLKTSELLKIYRDYGAHAYWYDEIQDEFHMVYAEIVQRNLDGRLNEDEKRLIAEAIVDYPPPYF